MLLNGQTDYRSFLRLAMAERMEKNPAYSMGALAKTAGISRSFLSEVLGGKKNLSPEVGARISRRLGLAPVESELFSLLIQLETAKDVSFREELLQKIRTLAPSSQIHDLSLDAFRAIADWYHLAILQLPKIDGFKISSATISRRLGITIAEAEAAIDRLLRLELLEKRPDGSYIKTSSRLLVEAKVPNGAVARFHRQVLGLAAEAAGEQPRAERKSRSEILPLHPEILAQAEAILDRAIEEIISLAAKSKTKTAVYGLSTQLFNLTPNRKK